MDSAGLYDRPDLYDLMAPADPVLEAFYIGVARERGGTVLDLACGSGRLTIPLARAGLPVTGADLSTTMLEQARQAAAAEALTIAFIQLDMRDFDLGRRFDTIVVAMNSVLHLETAQDFKGFFASAARHLTPGGRLVFDTFVPSPALLAGDPKTRHPVGTAMHPALGVVTVEETIRYDPIDQISHIDWYWSTAEERDFWRTPLRMRQIFPQELPLLVASGGLRLLERFGDFDRSPLAAGSFRQVCICGV